MDEHRVIERGIAVLREAASLLEAGKNVPEEVFAGLIDFIRYFADACHHAKEEGVLFTTMHAHGFPSQGGAIAVMLAEHDQGRAFVRGMLAGLDKYQAGDSSGKDDIVANARGYADLLTQHIQKEDNVLYPMADRVLGTADQEAMLNRFDEVEALHPEDHEKYHALIHQLEDRIATCR
jgi:hemerythrin-like domain-containing protein